MTGYSDDDGDQAPRTPGVWNPQAGDTVAKTVTLATELGKPPVTEELRGRVKGVKAMASVVSVFWQTGEEADELREKLTLICRAVDRRGRH